MNFLPPKIEEYSQLHTTEEPVYLHNLRRETYQKVLQPRMLSGHLQGRLLSMLSAMVRPHFVLEIGTYTGYSALCLAEGLADGGKVITIDINDELEEIATKYFSQSPFGENIQMLTGDAIHLIPNLDYSWDLVFIDADKSNYCKYYQLLLPKLKSGAIILADNVLWSGKVVEPVNAKDIDTSELLRFNKMVQEDPTVENVLLPIRDGLMMIKKK